MTTFEGLFWWSLLFLGLKSHKANPQTIRICMFTAAILILSIATFRGSANGFQQCQSSFSGHLCDSRRVDLLHGF